MVPLLPKLRGQFAEFLSVIFLKALMVYHLPTSVGLSTVIRLSE